MNPDPELQKTLQKIFCGFPDVQAVFLFGSVAERRARQGSDLDLAIVPGSPSIRERRLEIQAALVNAGLDPADLVFLDGRDIVLQYEAVRPNCLVYARDTFDRGVYYSRTIREYLDFLPYLAVQREALKRRILSA
jgi:hypothetical protein